MCPENGSYPLSEEVTEFQREELLEWFFNGSDLNTTIWVLPNPDGRVSDSVGVYFCFPGV